MSPLSIADKIELYTNLLSDPDDWVSLEILRLNELLEAQERDSNELRRRVSAKRSRSRLNNPSAIIRASVRLRPKPVFRNV